MMFGAITALTLSLIWAAQFLPGGSPSFPGLLSLGSLVSTPPSSINTELPTKHRCRVDIEHLVEQAAQARHQAERVRSERQQIRIDIDGFRHKRKHVHKHVHKLRHENKREWKRSKCRSRKASRSAIRIVPAIPPVPPVPPVPAIPPVAPLPAPGS